MRRLIDLVGRKFGKLTVLERAQEKSKGNTLWLCKCDCGNTSLVQGGSLRGEAVRSCGCLQKEKATKHGMEGTSIYLVWASMKARCSDENKEFYKYYGGRGIAVCDRWKDFENFYADMGDRPEGLSLDRIDNNKGYSPDNCRWATNLQQRRNTRINTWLEFNGERRVLTEWAEIVNLSPATIRSRLRASWTVDKALSTPPDKRKATKLKG
jgi:hypothetical protein